MTSTPTTDLVVVEPSVHPDDAVPGEAAVTRALTMRLSEPVPAMHLVPVVTSPAPEAAAQAPAGRARRRAARHTRPAPSVLSSSLALLGLAVLALLAQCGPLGWLEHARSQRVAYADLRRDLAAATVPTGQRDGDGALIPLGTALGYLTAPDLGLTREVLFEGTTSTVTEKGPGHQRSSVLPGQPGVAVLYGRAWGYGGPFRRVPDLRQRSVITVTTGQGQSTYRVTGVRRAGDPFQPPEPGRGVLTLVTAEGGPFVPTRAVYVDAELTSVPFEAPAPALTDASLSSAEGPLRGDSGVWPVLFMVMQALALSSVGLAWASRRFGGAQAWLVALPLIGLLALLASREALRLLPNLL